jgi:hypothetical protein
MKYPRRRLLQLTCLLSVVAACGSNGKSPTPTSEIVINEVMPANKTTCADEQGGYADWVELYNRGDAAVDLGGYSLSDNPQAPRKAVLPAGLIIAAKGVVVFWADSVPASGPTHLPFKLSKSGEGIILFDAAAKQLDEFAWTSAQSDVSYARVPDGTGAFVTCAAPTCSKSNGTACAK